MAGGSNNISRMSPRQKMINLMYIVLTAMLALNVSSDVLNGFRQVHSGIENTNENLSSRNKLQLAHLEDLYARNPAKAGASYGDGVRLHSSSKALYDNIESLKMEIARKADGKNADYRDLKNQEDLEAASVTMLDPISGRGRKLRRQVDAYRQLAVSMIADSAKRHAVEKLLSTKIPKDPGLSLNPSWEQHLFDNMPAVAAITLLSKLQNDIMHAESEALSSLITAVDIGDLRVNELNAYVIPNSNIVMRGGKYSADIVLAAIDSTSRPDIYVNGAKLADGKGHVELAAGSSGEHSFQGYIEVASADGSLQRHPFKSSYTVIEPMATISPTMMNVLYAGISNPISISVPGIPMSAISATMTNGTLVRSGDRWEARPGKIGTEAVVTVSAKLDGSVRQVGSMTFRVRKLPDPSPYLPVKDGSGNIIHYRGAPQRISKATLMAADRLGAAIDDEILNVTYSVVSFSTVFFDQMGNAIPELSDGARFSARQKEQFRRLRPGRSFLISNVKAKGPDGITRNIAPMEVAIN